jgi:lysophospholipase L1-like esterase
MNSTSGRTPPRGRAARFLRAALLAFVLLCAIFVLCEVVLKLAAAASPRIAYMLAPSGGRERIPDPILGYRLSPFFAGHDRLGYRNPAVPDSVQILTIGDSFTYGYAAPADSSWPRHLARLTQRSVYNGGVPGYGPCEYRMVFDELIRMNPRLVILSVHTGNDLSDAYLSVYEENRCRNYRSQDPAVLAQVEQLDRDSTLKQMAVARGWGDDEPAGALKQPPRNLRQMFSRHSATYALLREARLQMDSRKAGNRDRFAEDAVRPGRVVYTGSAAPRTVFKNPSMFKLAVDLEDARIREGMRLTQSMILDMDRLLKQRGTQFAVILIMDKPGMYAPIAADSMQLPRDFFQLADMEDQVAAELSAFLARNGIPNVNVATRLREALRNRNAVYPEWDDHHNNAQGYAIIAMEAARMISAIAPVQRGAAR